VTEDEFNILLDFRPQITKPKYGSEPSLRSIIRGFYGRDLEADLADEGALLYIQALRKQACAGQ